ncbi:MAG: hypothetical protein Q3976_05855 [Corynebacterium sp.]|nr:hypothetical protein [Corynebacterium sp.]
MTVRQSMLALASIGVLTSTFLTACSSDSDNQADTTPTASSSESSTPTSSGEASDAKSTAESTAAEDSTVALGEDLLGDLSQDELESSAISILALDANYKAGAYTLSSLKGLVGELSAPPGMVYNETGSDTVGYMIWDANQDIDEITANGFGDTVSLSAYEFPDGISTQALSTAVNKEIDRNDALDISLKELSSAAGYEISGSYQEESQYNAMQVRGFYWLNDDRTVLYQLTMSFADADAYTSGVENWTNELITATTK